MCIAAAGAALSDSLLGTLELMGPRGRPLALPLVGLPLRLRGRGAGRPSVVSEPDMAPRTSGDPGLPELGLRWAAVGGGGPGGLPWMLLLL